MTEELNEDKKIIIPSNDYIKEFKDQVGDFVFQQDLYEIVSQIIDVLLISPNNIDDALKSLPNIDRLICKKLVNEYDKAADQAGNSYRLLKLRNATRALALKLIAEMKNLGIFTGQDFSFMLDRFIGNDIVLLKFPF